MYSYIFKFIKKDPLPSSDYIKAVKSLIQKGAIIKSYMFEGGVDINTNDFDPDKLINPQTSNFNVSFYYKKEDGFVSPQFQLHYFTEKDYDYFPNNQLQFVADEEIFSGKEHDPVGVDYITENGLLIAESVNYDVAYCGHELELERLSDRFEIGNPFSIIAWANLYSPKIVEAYQSTIEVIPFFRLVKGPFGWMCLSSPDPNTAPGVEFKDKLHQTVPGCFLGEDR